MSEFQKSGLLPSFEPGLFLDARKIVMLKLIRKWTFFFTKKKTKAAKGYRVRYAQNQVFGFLGLAFLRES